MNRSQADGFVRRINSLGCVFTASVEDVRRYLPGYPCGVRVNHAGGNEVGFARDVDEGEYMTKQLEDRYGVPTTYTPEAGFIL